MDVVENENRSPGLGDSQSQLTTLGPDMINPKENALIKTWEPYSPQTEIKREKRKYKPNINIVRFNELFGHDSWKRFLILKTPGNKIKASELENLLLNEHSSKQLTFSNKDSETWIIETTTRNQSAALLEITKLGKYNVKFEEEEYLNSIEGTVILSPKYEEDGIPKNQEIEENLKLRGYNIRKVQVYEVPSKKFNKSMRIAKITFEGQTLPRNIIIEGMNKEVRPYVPKPLQCNKCSRYGHLTKHCRNKEICAYCSSSNHTTKWNCCEEPKCINCNNNHHARSKQCDFYNYNVELQLLLNRSILDIKAAKKELAIRGIKDPSRNASYRKLTKEKSSPQETNQNPKVNETIAVVTEQKSEENKEVDQRKGEVVMVEVHRENTGGIETQNKYAVLEDKLEDGEPKRSKRPLEPEEVASMTNSKKQELETASKQCVVPKESKTKLNTKISSSPVITTTIPNPHPSVKQKEKQVNTIDHKQSCQCLDCIKTYVNAHKETCGCHECYIKLLNNSTNKTKTDYDNIIKFFIQNKKIDSNIDLHLHQDKCMCVEHLKLMVSETKKNFESIIKETENTKGATAMETENDHISVAQYSRIRQRSNSAVNLHNLKPLI